MAARSNETTYYSSGDYPNLNLKARIKYNTFSTTSDASDVRTLAQKVIDANPREKILILTGVHSADSRYAEPEFTREDRRSTVALGAKNVEVLDVAKIDDDGLLNVIAKLKPDRIIYASCHSDRNLDVPNTLQHLGYSTL